MSFPARNSVPPPPQGSPALIGHPDNILQEVVPELGIN